MDTRRIVLAERFEEKPATRLRRWPTGCSARARGRRACRRAVAPAHRSDTSERWKTSPEWLTNSPSTGMPGTLRSRPRPAARSPGSTFARADREPPTFRPHTKLLVWATSVGLAAPRGGWETPGPPPSSFVPFVSAHDIFRRALLKDRPPSRPTQPGRTPTRQPRPASRTRKLPRSPHGRCWSSRPSHFPDLMSSQRPSLAPHGAGTSIRAPSRVLEKKNPELRSCAPTAGCPVARGLFQARSAAGPRSSSSRRSPSPATPPVRPATLLVQRNPRPHQTIPNGQAFAVMGLQTVTTARIMRDRPSSPTPPLPSARSPDRSSND